MLAILIYVCVIIAQINGDVDSDIRADEEQRHNTTITKFVKAALGGALHHLFPSVTEKETEEAEKLYADVFPLGDPSRPLPVTDETIESNLCRNHRERGHKIQAYIRKRYPTHLITQIATRLGIHDFGEKNDEYCRDSGSRKIYTTNASVINAHINEFNASRNHFIDNYMAMAYGNATHHKIAIVCCSIFNLRKQFVNALPTQESKNFVLDYVNSYLGKALNYLCVYHSDGSKACDNLSVPPPPTNVTRFESIVSASITVITKLRSIEKQ